MAQNKIILTRGLVGASIFSDSKYVLSVIYAHLEPPWEYEAVIDDIRFLASDLNLSFSFVSRNANAVAYWVATECNRFGLPPNWYLTSDPRLTSMLAKLGFL